MQPNAEELKRLKQTCIIPQKEEGTYAIRIRSVGGDMQGKQMEAIAKAADRYGRPSMSMRKLNFFTVSINIYSL